MKTKKIAFLDRDGVINEDYGYVHKWENFKFCDGAIQGIHNLIDLDFGIIIITNQSGIDRGIFSKFQYFELTNIMLDFFEKNDIQIIDIYHCPHHPEYSELPFKNCDCRKPKPGLFKRAINKYKINTKESISVGDNERDLVASKLAGINKRYLISKDMIYEKNDIFDASFKSLLDCSEFLKNNN